MMRSDVVRRKRIPQKQSEGLVILDEVNIDVDAFIACMIELDQILFLVLNL
jgi:hypothetical protein